MRLPKPRFTLRRLMLAVVIAAVVLAAGAWGLKSVAYQRRAAYHRAQLRIWPELPYINAQQYSEAFEALLRQRGWHEAMADKYERAARYPWLCVEPDPPEPSSGM
jgi:hypothetical protein